MKLDTKLFLYFSHCKQKQMYVCLEGLFKHVSWKIYGSLELNCAGLLLEKGGNWAETCFINLPVRLSVYLRDAQARYSCNTTHV